MNYKLCPLYGLKSKRKLLELLGISNPSTFPISAKDISKTIKPKIDYSKGKGRLVEPPFHNLKSAQKRLLAYLQKLDFPFYVFCGVKGKTVADNAKIHSGLKYVYQTDLSKFFPHITRNKIYNFFIKKMQMSSDVSNILTNICTIDYCYVDNEKYIDVFIFFSNNYLKPNSHLMTGSPASCILSYLVNIDMFDAIYKKGSKQDINMSIYIDDITFSSFKPITHDFIQYVNRTLKRYNYKISAYKCQYNTPKKVKKITGVIIDKAGNIKVANHIKYTIHKGLASIKKKESTSISQLKGFLSFTSLVEPKYKNVQRQIYTLKTQ